VSAYVVESLAQHDRRTFNCGSPDLDRYFREQVGQDVRRRVAACFVAVASDGAIAGFYTLAATSLAFDSLSLERAKRMPRYPVLPAILLGRLAVSTAHRGLGLGAALVADAIQRATGSDVIGFAMVVEAKDAAAEQFYTHLGFEPLAERRLIRRL
jgi:GNAT superfamily N-acetyltransferase